MLAFLCFFGRSSWSWVVQGNYRTISECHNRSLAVRSNHLICLRGWILSQGLASAPFCHSPAVHPCRHACWGQRSTPGVVPQDGCPLYPDTGSPTGICCLPDSVLAGLGGQDTPCFYLPSTEITSMHHTVWLLLWVLRTKLRFCACESTLPTESYFQFPTIHSDWKRSVLKAQQDTIPYVVTSHFPGWPWVCSLWKLGVVGIVMNSLVECFAIFCLCWLQIFCK